MKKISISEDNRGVSKLLVIGIIVIVVIAALAGIGYYYLNEKSATINYTIEGAAYEDSDVIVYLDGKEISKSEVKAQSTFRENWKYTYIFTDGDSKEITMVAKIMDKEKNVIKTVEKTLEISAKKTYDVELKFPIMKLSTIVNVDSPIDFTISIKIDGEEHARKQFEGSSNTLQYTYPMIWLPNDDLSRTFTVFVVVFYSDDYTWSETLNVTVDVNSEKDVTFDFDYADL